MAGLIARRLVAFAPTLLIVAIITFALEHIVPGGPALALVGASGGGSRTIALINQQLGLNKPLLAQFGTYVGHVLQGQLGQSYINHAPVSTIIGQHLGPSIELIAGALVLSLILGVGAGILSAVKRDTRLGQLILTASGGGLSIPDFWLATLAAGIVGVDLKLLPATGYVPLGDGLVPNLRTMIMPVIILSIPTSAFICRHLRSSMTAALESPYIRTSWAMGVRAPVIYFRFALRNAVTPVINFLPLVISGLIGATVVVEFVFAIPGIGSEIISAVTDRDYPTLQAIVLMVAVVVLVLNLLADVAVGAIDPRVRSGAGT
jgi:peptide/nickel transport system permease protein